VILALLGLAELFTGNLAAVIPLLIKGVDDVIKGANDINWAKLRCQLYWYRLYFYNGLKAVHDASVLVGIHHPYAADLAIDQTTLSLLGLNFTFDSGKRLTRSRPERSPYPADIWNGIAPSWTQDPAGVEKPETLAYNRGVYPSYWIDDAAANPLGQGRVREDGPWPVKVVPGTKGAAGFGNAVDNAIDLLLNAGADLPNWNLDGDRGLAYFTWEVKDQYSNPLNITPET
jgi:hypothetical protein